MPDCASRKNYRSDGKPALFNSGRSHNTLNSLPVYDYVESISVGAVVTGAGGDVRSRRLPAERSANSDLTIGTPSSSVVILQ